MLQNNVTRVFKETFPLDYREHTITVSDITFDEPNGGYQEQKDAFLNEDSLETRVRGNVSITKDGKEVAKHKDIVITTIPHVTERGTYILGGNEKVFINQMTLRPGIYVNKKKALANGEFIRADIRAGKKRFTLTFNETKGTLDIEGLGMDFGYEGKKISAISFLLFMGVSEQAIKDAIGNDAFYESLKAKGKNNTPEKIYKAFFERPYPGKEQAIEDVNAYMNEFLVFDEKGQRIQKEVIGKSFQNVSPEAFLQTLRQMFKEFEEPDSTTNIDDMRFKEVYNNEEVIARGVERGINEWVKLVKSRIRNNNVKSSNIRPAGYFVKEMNKLYNSTLSEQIDSGNPLDMLQKRKKITLGGPGGLTDRAVKEENRNLQDTAFGKIDPVETPQSSKLGVSQHIAQGAVIKNGTIYSKFYKVVNGKIDTSRVLDDVDPFDEHDEYVAFNNPKFITKSGKTWTLKKGDVRVRHKGDFKTVDSSLVTLMDHKPDSHLGNATALVPFGAHNDGARMLMGASMQRQAMSLANPDEPLVQSISDGLSGKTTEQDLADSASFLLKSPIDGKVTRIEDDFIEVEGRGGQKEKVSKLNYFSTGKAGGYINHKPTVKIGDSVKKDSLLADGWQSKNGKLALGKNTVVAYMPYDGYNFEDGVVVSESWADKMSSEEVQTLEYELHYDEDVVPIEETKKRLKQLLVSDGILAKLDARGIIKKGSEISSGDILAGFVKTKTKSEMSGAERLLRKTIVIENPTDSFIDRSRYAQGYQKGKIIDVETMMSGSTLKVSIKLLSFKSMEVGDKLSGRHGNKGTITKILPDNEMPMTKDKAPVELIFSPLAVPSRKNIGQLLEVNAGLVAQKKGMSSYNVQNFNQDEKDKLFKELEEIGIPDGKQELVNPKTGKAYENKVTVGPMYVMKLKHKVEGKISARDIGTDDHLTGLPKKVSGSIDGDRNSPQNIGGMEFWSLTSAGAVHNIHEMTTLKSDGSGSAEDKLARIKIYEALRHGTPIPDPVTPQTLKVLQEQLYGAGVQITPLRNGKKTSIDEKFTSLMLQPLHAEQIEKMAPEKVIESKTFDNRTGKKDPKGLYSEEVFGKDGDKWGRIDVGDGMPNPIYLQGNTGPRPYEAMLTSKGIKQGDLIKIMEQGDYIVLDPKKSGKAKYSLLSANQVEELIDLEDVDMEVATGAKAISSLLEEVNLEDELKLAEGRLKSSTKPGERSKAHQHVRLLSSALDNGYAPKDYLLPFVPVLPTKYREPVKAGSDDKLAEDGITLLYQNLMKKNRELDKAIDGNDGNFELIDRTVYSKLEADRYQTVKNIVGVGKEFQDTKRDVQYDGIIHRMKGKPGFLRSKMQSKAQDYSGRSVIVVDPELNMDQAGIPEDMAAKIFAPKIQSALQKDKYSPREIIQIMEERSEPFRRALSEIAENEVVLLNRQPSLHKHSIQAFEPVIRWDGDKHKQKAIGLNPIVTTGFNADFDGDSLLNSVFVRIEKDDIETELSYSDDGSDDMPLSEKEKIRYKNGLINLKDFPRTSLRETKGNIEIHNVPEGIEILTVWNNEKKWLPVESYSIHKDLNMLEVSTNTSRTIQVSDDHSLVTVDDELNYMRAPAENGMTLPRLREVISKHEYDLIDDIELPEGTESKYKFPDKLKVNGDLGYFFGAYIGDGWVSTDSESSHRNAICMSDKDGKVMKKIESYLNDLSDSLVGICNVDHYHEFDGKSSHSVKRTWHSRRFSDLLRKYIGSTSSNKKLPDFWIQTPKSFRQGLLSGLIDTDGSVLYTKRQTHINYTTTSHTLAYDVVGLAHSLDLTASVTVTQTPKGKVCYVVSFTQESINDMKSLLWLVNDVKSERLQDFEITTSAKRNKYTPKLSRERLIELRKAIGSPRFKNRAGELIVDEKEIPSIKKRKSLNVVVNRVEKSKTAITRGTAIDIIEVIPEFFEDGFWLKWKELVLDENIEWELVTSIEPIPFITEAYDLTVPPNYTMVTESGIIVYDTMAVHVPITDAAKAEAKEKLMPSQNLLNPTNNSIIMDLKHEMQLGIYYMTRDRVPTGVPVDFKNIKELRKAYDLGEVTTYQSVRMNVPQKGTVTSTAGKHLFNSVLPPAYVDFEKNTNIKKENIEKILFDIMGNTRYGPMKAVQIINELKDLGFKASTMGAVSIGVKDFDKVTSIDKDKLFNDAEKDPSVAKHINDRERFDVEKSIYVEGKIEEMIKGGVLGYENPVEIMRASGARGNAGQIMAMSALVGTGKDVSSRSIRPVKSSLIEGSTPDEFWDLSNDARKGIYDRSVASQGPGELTRYVWMANKQTVISEKDCGDKVGISLDINKETDSKALVGRILLNAVKLKNGGTIQPKRGEPLTRQEIEKIQNEAVEKANIKVRSSLTCKSTSGICQYCYGAKPGAVNSELVPIGEAVGSLAAQAIGEPSQQAIMKTFHTGAGNSNLTNAFEQIKDSLSLPKSIPNKAILVQTDGEVTAINHDPLTGTIISVGRRRYKIGKLPIVDGLRVGVAVKQGESLTKEFDPVENKFMSVRDPREVLQYEGIDAARDYITKQVEQAFESGGIKNVDRRHTELVINNMTNRAVIDDGGTTNLITERRAPIKSLQAFNTSGSATTDVSLDYGNRMNVIGAISEGNYSAGIGGFGKSIVKKGEPITEEAWEELRKNRKFIKVKKVKATFTPELQGVGADTKLMNSNWLEHAARGNAGEILGQGSANFMEDKLDNPLTRQMTGLKGNFGSGFMDWASDMKDKFGGMFT